MSEMKNIPDLPNYFNDLSEYEYVPKAYRKLPKQYQPKFVLKALTMEEQAVIEDARFGFTGEAKKEGEEEASSTAQYKRGTELLLAFNMGLKEWHNFLDTTGKEIPYNKPNKGKLAPELWKEIGEEVITASSLTSTEKENL